MNFKKLCLLIGLAIISMFVVACNKEKESDATPIIDVLNQGKNNDNVIVEGVVYGVLTNGFYVADSAQGKIFVIMGNEWTKNVTDGDKVRIKGQFSYVSHFPQIKNVEEVTTLSSGNSSFVSLAPSSVTEINALDATAKTGSYANLYQVTGIVSKTAAGVYQISDDEGNKLFVNDGSNTEALAAKLDQRVKLSVITHKISVSDNVWIVSFTGTASDIVDDKLTFASIKQSALTYINSVVPSEIYGALVLPTAHPTQAYIAISWDVVANDYVSIDATTGLVTVKIDSVDHDITFKLTISDGVESETMDYVITSKAIVERSVAQLFSDTPKVEMSVVIVRGLVVGIARNQSESLRSYIIKDMKTQETITVDFGKAGDGVILNTDEQFKKVEVGDEILVTGKFRIASRTTIMNVSQLQVVSKDNPYSHDYQNALTLDSSTAYLELANNYDAYANKLVKFVNPFMNYSTSSTPAVTNWVRLGYDATSGDAGHGSGTNVHYFAFLIAAQNESLGSDIWHTMYEIPFYNAGAKQFGVTIYAYALYVSDTYFAFVIPDWDCYQVSGVDAINVALSQSLPTTIENGTISLLTTHELVEGKVTWTSSNDNVINSLTGKVTEVNENTEVILTATFKYQGTTYTRDYKVSVLKAKAMSVTELLASGGDKQAVKVSGTIIGYVSDGNTVDTRLGVVILDNETGKTVMVNGLSSLGGTYGAYLDSAGNLLAIGDEILVVGTYYLNTPAIGNGPEQTGRNYIEVTADSTITLLGKTENINYQNVLVVTNHEEMQALADNLIYGTIIKLVGTEENPLFLGGSSSKLPFNIKLFYNKKAVDNNGTKYNGKIFSLKSDVNEANAGSEWYNAMFNIPTAFVGPTEANPSILVTGELYVVLGYTTGTYYQMSIINARNCTMSRVLTYEQLTDLFANTFPSTVVSQSTDFALPTTHNKVVGSITWTSENNTLINPSTWAIGTVATSTEVKLTASFTYDGQVRAYEHTVTVLPVPAAAPLSVSKALEEGVAGMSLGITGIIAAYHADGNTSGILRGIVLMDEVTHQTILIDGMELVGTSTHGKYQATNGNLLAIGDKVVIEGATFAISGKRQSVEVAATSTVTVSSSNNTITWDVEQAITISTNAQMQEFANNLQFGKLIKFVGTAENPICTGGSSSKLPFNIKIFFNKAAVDNDGTKYNGKIFALKSDINEFNAGNDWWKTLFGFTAAFVGPKDAVGPIKFTGTLYVVLSAETSTYYQMAIVNLPSASLTRLNN
ncbi:MAG TPA: hypothetical protein PLQ99_04450 [Bacilli bacterium]|nr:hypothetical protein [Bacilli bacterium]